MAAIAVFAAYFPSPCLAVSTTSSGALAIQVPDPVAMGLVLTESKAPDGRKVLTTKDTKTGYILKATYSPLGRLAELEEYSAGGALLDRRTFDGRRFTQTSFRNGFTFVEYERTGRTVRGAPEMRRVTYTRLPGDKPQTDDRTFVPGPELHETSCIGGENYSDLAASLIMRNFEPVSATNASDTGAMHFRFGSNPGMTFEVGEACDGYHNGRYQMASDFEEAVNIGLKCLGGKGPRGDLGPQARMDAARLIAFMQVSNDATIKCLPGDDDEIEGANARALSCADNDGVPGMILNLDSSSRRPVGSRVQTLFHEMLHWLGYLHYEGAMGGVDMPYLASICCFERDERACDLLKVSDSGGCSLPTTSAGLPSCPANTGGVAFMGNFARVLADSGRINIAYTDAWTRSYRTGNVQWSDGRRYPDLSLLMRASMTEGEDVTDTTRFTLAWIAAGNVTREVSRGGEIVREFVDRSEIEPRLETAMDNSLPASGMDAEVNGARRQFAQALGTLLSRAVNYGSGSGQYKDAYKEFKRVRESACPHIPDYEQADVTGTVKTMLMMHEIDVSHGFRCMSEDLCNDSDFCLF